MKYKLVDLGLKFGEATEGYTRSEGLHASDLYGSLFKKLNPKRFDKRGKDGKPLPMDMLRVELGTTFEELLEPVIAARLLGARPPEMRSKHQPSCPDRRKRLSPKQVCSCGAGIYFSPDYLFDEDGELILGEFKLTWMSMKGFPIDPKFAKWISQCKLYCYWLGITKVRLVAFFVNGDWKDFQPVQLAWELEFTQRELELNFNMLMREGVAMGVVPKKESR